MSDQKKPAEISGWYVRTKTTDEEKRRVEDWYEKRVRLNYRTVPIEAPGKMILALGELARQKGMDGARFGDFIEGILDEYMQRQGINWRDRV
jgi:hypothetical protein